MLLKLRYDGPLSNFPFNFNLRHFIVAALREWARTTNGTAVIALLQPTPEVFNQFDQLLLLREGAPVYHGPRAAAVDYFAGLGFVPPSAASGEDIADWFVNLVATPEKAFIKGSRSASMNDIAAMPLTTKALAAAWLKSPLFAKSTAVTVGAEAIELKTPFAETQYGLAYPRSFGAHFKSVLLRQHEVTIRNKLFVGTRVFSALVTSLILGSVWYQLPQEKGFEKLGMLLFSILHVSFANFAELTFSVEQKYVAYKHLDMKLFPPFSYIASWQGGLLEKNDSNPYRSTTILQGECSYSREDSLRGGPRCRRRMSIYSRPRKPSTVGFVHLTRSSARSQ